MGVGGIGPAADAIERLAAGAHHVQIATAAMINPAVGIDIRDALARRAGVAVGRWDAATERSRHKQG